MQPPIGLNSTIQCGDNLVSCDLDGETALMSVDQEMYYGLNPIASRIWTLLQQARPVAALCALLQEEFEVELAQCERDVLAFLNEMAHDNLIKVVNEPGV
jgi:hypothetical protein